MTPETDEIAQTEVAPAAAPPEGVRVWDLPVRLFHWLLVLLIVSLWITAIRGWMTVHYIAGVSTLVLVLFRVTWGFFGSTTARFSDFLAGPRHVLAYLRGLRGGEDQRHAGHNPAGGWMVLTFLLLILAQATIGLFANDEFAFKGPFAEWISGKRSDLLTRIHVFLFDAILVCIWLHLCAITFYVKVKRDDLVRPMLNGSRTAAQVPKGQRLEFAPARRALFLLLAVTIVIVLLIVNARRMFE